MDSSDKKRDLLLEKAAISYVEQESRRIRAEMEALKDDPEYQPSRQQQEAFEKLLRRESGKLKRARRQKHMVQFAGILLAVIVGVTSASFVFVEAFRVRVLYMVKEFEDTYMDINMRDTMEMDPEDMMLSKFLPPGFTVVSYDRGEDVESIHAENEAGNYLLISMREGSARTSLDTEEADVRELAIGDTQVLLIEKDFTFRVLWNDQDYYYTSLTDLEEDVLLDFLKKVL